MPYKNITKRNEYARSYQAKQRQRIRIALQLLKEKEYKEKNVST
jgi:hypothetical protein